MVRLNIELIRGDKTDTLTHLKLFIYDEYILKSGREQ